MRFLILGDDVSGSRAYDNFRRSVDRTSRSVDRNNKAMDDQNRHMKVLASGVASAGGAFTGFGDFANVASRKTSMFTKVLAGLNLATSVLEPAMAGLVVTTGALASAMVSGGVGLAAFAAAAAPAIKQAAELNKTQQQAAQGVTQAQAYVDALKKAPPAVRRFASELDAAGAVYQGWARQLAAPVLRPFETALTMINPLLHQMGPFARAAAAGINDVVLQMSAAVRSTGFREWLAKVLPNVRPVISDLGELVLNLAKGIGGIAAAFGPVVTKILGGITSLTAKFAEWGQTLTGHSGFQALMKMFADQTPMAVAVLKNLGEVIVNITAAMAGLASPGNSKALLQILMPLSSIMRVLSQNQFLLRTVLYFGLLYATLKRLQPVIMGAQGAIMAFRAGNGVLGRTVALVQQFAAGFRSATAAGLPVTGLAGTIGGKLRPAVDKATGAIKGLAARSTVAGAAAGFLGRGLAFIGTGAAGAAASIVGAAAAGALLAIAIRHSDDATADFVDQLRRESQATGFNVAGYQKYIGALSQARAETTANRAAIERQTISAVAQQRQLIANTDRQRGLTEAQQAAVAQNRDMTTALATLAAKYNITIPQAAELAAKAGVQADAFQRGGRMTANATDKINSYTEAARLSHNPAQQVSNDLQAIGNRALSADTQLAALNSTLQLLVGNYNDLIGTHVAAAQALDDLAKKAQEVGKRTGFATQKQRDLTTQLQATTKSALDFSSATFKQTGNVKKSIKPLVDEVQQIVRLGLKGPVAKRTTDNLVGAIIKLGEKGGWSEGKIANLISRILHIPKKRAWELVMQGTGRWNVHQARRFFKTGANPTGFAIPRAGGGPVRGPGTGTSDTAGLYALSNREYVVKAAAADKYGPKRMAAVNAGTAQVSAPGLAAGGFPGPNPGVTLRGNLGVLSGDFARARYTDTFASTSNEMIHQMWAEMAHQMRMAMAGGRVAEFARKFATGLNHPYVWGGVTPRGWDCSGFTSYVLSHFGYGPPRTSEAQYTWGQRAPDQPGALVFFVGAGGGPPPSHVGISMGNGMMANASSPAVGTIMSTVAGNMGFRIPPGGWQGGKFRGTQRENQLSQLWSEAGGPPAIAHLMAAIAMAESGGRVNAIGPMTRFGQAKGLWQILGQLVPGNIFNPLVNARNAVAKWHLQGLSAWEAYTNGNYRQFLAGGGAIREPVLGVGRSGTVYHLGEAGFEYVSSQADLKAVAQLLSAVLGELRKQTPHIASGPERTGAATGAALNGTSRRAALGR